MRFESSREFSARRRHIDGWRRVFIVFSVTCDITESDNQNLEASHRDPSTSSMATRTATRVASTPPPYARVASSSPPSSSSGRRRRPRVKTVSASASWTEPTSSTSSAETLARAIYSTARTDDDDRAESSSNASSSSSNASRAASVDASRSVVYALKRVARERPRALARAVAWETFVGMSSESSSAWPNAHVCTTIVSIIASSDRSGGGGGGGARGETPVEDSARTDARAAADKAMDILTWMKRACDERGVVECAPTTYTYTACVSALDGANAWEKAMDLFSEMKTRGVGRNAHTYSALVRAGSKGGRAGARAAIGLIQEMKKDGVEPDLPIASALISAFGVLGASESARAMLRAIESSGRSTDAKLYVDYITAMCRCGEYDEAIETFTRVGRTTHTCTAVMKAYAEAMQWRLAEELFEEMRASGPPPSDTTHTAVLHAYEKSLEWKRAVRLLDQLIAENSAKEIHYNITLSVLGKCMQWERAEALFRLMRDVSGLSPSRVTYSTLISAYGRSGKTELGRKVFNQMLARRIPPDDYTFVGLMLGPASEGDVRECAKIASEMKLFGVEHTVHTYNAMIQCADIAGNYDKAVEIYEELLSRGIEPNGTTKELVVAVGKRGANYYDRQQKTAAVASYAAGLVGVMGMALGRW